MNTWLWYLWGKGCCSQTNWNYYCLDRLLFIRRVRHSKRVEKLCNTSLLVYAFEGGLTNLQPKKGTFLKLVWSNAQSCVSCSEWEKSKLMISKTIKLRLFPLIFGGRYKKIISSNKCNAFGRGAKFCSFLLFLQN